jgi:hypothetical protein
VPKLALLFNLFFSQKFQVHQNSSLCKDGSLGKRVKIEKKIWKFWIDGIISLFLFHF